ncbi:MAG: DUF4185 domain-containing protein [Mycobacteriaceae bacterium]|nr:DUF4185 domain-containing protein [Mycobacteriaceae bacterium]
MRGRSLGLTARTGSLLPVFAGVCATIALLTSAAAPTTANPNNINPLPGINGTNGLPHLPGPTQAVYQVTGMASPNQTQGLNVLGTDLGIMWDSGHGNLMVAFGDTAGLGVPNLLAGSIWAWTSNMLFRSRTVNPAGGLVFDSYVPSLIPSPKIPGIEISRIPTAGISVNGVQYLSMMSVRQWKQDGRWSTNFTSLAVSGDNGQNWVELPATRRTNVDGYENFQMSAYVKSDGHVYRFGTPPGRDNPGFVSRVPEGAIADYDAYEYWDGKRWTRKATAAAPIVGGVGELSVMWNEYLHRFVMLTTDPWNSVVMRTAPAPQGPWTPPQVLIDTRALPTAYAPMIFPYQTGRDLYYLVTVHSQYNVLLMRTPL